MVHVWNNNTILISARTQFLQSNVTERVKYQEKYLLAISMIIYIVDVFMSGGAIDSQSYNHALILHISNALENFQRKFS